MLTVENVTVSFGKLVAVDNFSLALEAGGYVHGIIGPNGAGKSTLMDAITGRRKLNQGRIRIANDDVTDRSVPWRRRHGLARSFQKTSIFPDLTVREQLELVAIKVGESDISGVVEALELGPVIDMVAGGIAYGIQRRVDVALALLGRPRILLLDEPAAGLSSAETEALFMHVVKLVREQGILALIVEHDVDAVFRFCEKITVMNFGRHVVTGGPTDVRTNPEVISAYLGSAA